MDTLNVLWVWQGALQLLLNTPPRGEGGGGGLHLSQLFHSEFLIDAYAVSGSWCIAPMGSGMISSMMPSSYRSFDVILRAFVACASQSSPHVPKRLSKEWWKPSP